VVNNKKNKVKFTLESNISRKQYGPKTEQEVWGIKIHQELRELYKIHDLAAGIKRVS
jgi:hypothetical protein